MKSGWRVHFTLLRKSFLHLPVLLHSGWSSGNPGPQPSSWGVHATSPVLGTEVWGPSLFWRTIVSNPDKCKSVMKTLSNMQVLNCNKSPSRALFFRKFLRTLSSKISVRQERGRVRGSSHSGSVHTGDRLPEIQTTVQATWGPFQAINRLFSWEVFLEKNSSFFSLLWSMFICSYLIEKHLKCEWKLGWWQGSSVTVW